MDASVSLAPSRIVMAGAVKTATLLSRFFFPCGSAKFFILTTVRRWEQVIWIDGSQYGSTVTTTIPAGALQPFFQIINTEAAAKLLDIDAFQFAMTVSR